MEQLVNEDERLLREMGKVVIQGRQRVPARPRWRAGSKERADAFLGNPNVYPFPALSKVVKGPPEINFDRVWEVASNPVHWGDDSCHKIVDLENPAVPPFAWERCDRLRRPDCCPPCLSFFIDRLSKPVIGF